MEFRFSKQLYPKIALLKSAYHFTDKAYLHLDQDEEDYIVQIEYKGDARFELQEFQNEMLTQTVRYEILRQTKDLRRLTLALALASTIIEDESIQEGDVQDDFDVNDVLKDWFANEEA